MRLQPPRVHFFLGCQTPGSVSIIFHLWAVRDFALHWPSFGLPLLPEIARPSRTYLGGGGSRFFPGWGFVLGVTAQRWKIMLTPGV